MSAVYETSKLADSPIDLEHLRTVTFHDTALEREVLGLFGERASASLVAIQKATSTQELGDAAHRLVGAARAIGARELAAVAEQIEVAEMLTIDAAGSLSGAMAAVVAFLESRLRGLPDPSGAG